MRIILGILAVIAIVLLAVWAIDVDVSGDVEMPNVEVTGGELPDVDVETVDVDVSMEEKTVELPDVDVEMEETTITLPDVDVTAPEEDTVAEEDDL